MEKELLKLIKLLIPDNTEFSDIINGIKVSASNHNGDIKIDIEKTDYDDSEIKEIVNKYKENIEKIDDCLFLDILEDIKEHIDIKEFNDLLDKESFTEEDAEIVRSMIAFSNAVIREYIQNKISDLNELLNEF